MPPADSGYQQDISAVSFGAARGDRERQSFRPEVQALRALAVSGVVIYHLWPGALPGGFVGVDAFFVISGFLITSLLLSEARSTGRVSLTNFWARRARRLLPAAFAVLFFCILLVTAVMPRVTWQSNLTDIRAAAAYFVNWQLGADAVNYLASSQGATVVQHYWSLSVEEQFYLGWPLLLLGGLWASRRISRRRPHVWLALMMGAVALASFVTSVIWTARQPAVAFFATPTRAWEFAIGGLIAIAMRDGRSPRGHVQSAMSGLGQILLAGSMLEISRHDAFPGSIALLPVAGAALMIAAGSPDESKVVARWVRTTPVQWVGDNSYSIYLWHWPLIVAAPWVTHSAIRWPAKVLILVATPILAALSKIFIEDPVRAGGFWRTRRWPAYSLAALGLVAIVAVSGTFTSALSRSQHHEEALARVRSAALVKQPHSHSCFGAAAMIPADHCTHPFARPGDLDTEFAANDGGSEPCLQGSADPATPRYCVFGGMRNPKQVIAVIGNSHGWRLIPALRLYAQQHHWQIIEASRVDCLGLITTATSPAGASSSCLSWGRQVEQHLLGMPQLTGVVFASYQYWQNVTVGANPTPDEVRATRAQILTMWHQYRARGVHVFAVQDVPGMRPTLDPQCIQQSLASYDPCSVPASQVVKPTPVTTLSLQHPALASYVPIDQYFCSAGMCHGLIGGVVVYFDQQHMSTTFARSLAEPLGSALATDFGPAKRA